MAGVWGCSSVRGPNSGGVGSAVDGRGPEGGDPSALLEGGDGGACCRWRRSQAQDEGAVQGTACQPTSLEAARGERKKRSS